MHEYYEYELHGEERAKIKKDILQQINIWGLCLPIVEPLMLHFGVKNFKNVGETEFWVANEVEAGYCAKFIFIFDNQTCPLHYHKVKHETFFIVKGKARMNIDGKDLFMKGGDKLVIEPGIKHSFTGEGNCLLLEVSMPSVPGDSYFEEISDSYGKKLIL